MNVEYTSLFRTNLRHVKIVTTELCVWISCFAVVIPLTGVCVLCQNEFDNVAYVECLLFLAIFLFPICLKKQKKKIERKEPNKNETMELCPEVVE